jgi:hypothetical protein
MGNDVQHCCTPATAAARLGSDVASPRAREALLAIGNAGALGAWQQQQREDSRGFRLSMKEGLEAGRAIFENSLTIHPAERRSYD